MHSILVIGGHRRSRCMSRPPPLGIRQVRYQKSRLAASSLLQAQELAALPNVRLLAAPDGYAVESLTQAFEGAELAFVNTDDFVVRNLLGNPDFRTCD
jgi:hypothetical protein